MNEEQQRHRTFQQRTMSATDLTGSTNEHTNGHNNGHTNGHTNGHDMEADQHMMRLSNTISTVVHRMPDKRTGERARSQQAILHRARHGELEGGQQTNMVSVPAAYLEAMNNVMAIVAEDLKNVPNYAGRDDIGRMEDRVDFLSPPGSPGGSPREPSSPTSTSQPSPVPVVIKFATGNSTDRTRPEKPNLNQRGDQRGRSSVEGVGSSHSSNSSHSSHSSHGPAPAPAPLKVNPFIAATQTQAQTQSAHRVRPANRCVGSGMFIQHCGAQPCRSHYQRWYVSLNYHRSIIIAQLSSLNHHRSIIMTADYIGVDGSNGSAHLTVMPSLNFHALSTRNRPKTPPMRPPQGSEQRTEAGRRGHPRDRDRDRAAHSDKPPSAPRTLRGGTYGGDSAATSCLPRPRTPVGRPQHSPNSA